MAAAVFATAPLRARALSTSTECAAPITTSCWTAWTTMRTRPATRDIRARWCSPRRTPSPNSRSLPATSARSTDAWAAAWSTRRMRSGTNQFHGTAYEFLRNTDLNATGFTFSPTVFQKPTLQRNQFGVTIGGPIIKNKLFFFGDYEGSAAVAAISQFRFHSGHQRPQRTADQSRDDQGVWSTIR